MTRLFHIVDRAGWDAAVSAGVYRPESLATEGFVHFSFAGQVGAVANARYRDRDDLVVVEIDASGLEVVVEDSYRSGTEFPHVYAPIPTALAVAVHPLRRLPDGDYAFSPGRGSGAAWPDR